MKEKATVVLLLYCINFCFALTGAKYLIITPDNFVSAVQPLADWKTKKGMKAKVVPLSVTGSSASQIKTYIVNAYNTWDIRPEYILLAGSTVPVSNNSDDYYANISGSYRIELSIGRFPATSGTQVQNIVAKTLAFERTPCSTDSTWLMKGTTIVREDGSSSSDPIYWANARYVHNHWRNYQYNQIDSFSKDRGHTSSNVTTAINNGRMFVVYRGQGVSNWWTPFAMTPDNLSNGSKTPIVVSGTCVTMFSSGYLGEQFINAGSSSNPKGAVGFFGTTSSGSGIAAQRGAVTEGFFRAIFAERTFCLGDAAKRGKFLLDSVYNNPTRYAEWNLFGDPELNIWTEKPIQLTVVHDTLIQTQTQNFAVTVSRSVMPLSGALVCVTMDTTIYKCGYTNQNGIASFSITPQSTGTMSVTVTYHNFIPYEKDVIVRPGNLDHDVGVLSIIEPQGTVALGSNIIPKVKVKNYGTNTDSFPVTLKIGTVYQEMITSVTLGAGDTITVLFPVWTAVGGNHSVLSYTWLYNDQWRGNDTAVGTVSVVVAHDVGVDAILSPDSSHPINISLIPKARIKNYGSTAQSNFSATCSIVGATGILRYANTQIVTSIAPSETVQLDFSGWVPTVSERCTVKMRTNLIGDQNPANDQLTRLTRITMVFLAEGFNTSFPPDGWQSTVVQGTYSWEGRSSNTNPICTPYEGSAMASYQSYSAPSGSMARLISLPLAIGTTPVICSLKFFMYHDPGYPGPTDLGPDSVKIEYSTNGTSFNRVAAFRRYEATAGWTEHSVYLGTLSGTIYAGFLALSQYGNNMNIDYVRMFSAAGVNEEIKPTNDLHLLTILNAPKPNPVTNGSALISFSVAEPADVALKIYDASGKLVKNLVNIQLTSGNYNYTWNGKDELNRAVAKGIYFCTLETQKQNLTRKMIFTR